MKRSRDDLGRLLCESVKRAAIALGCGLLRHPSNDRLRGDLATGRQSSTSFGHQVVAVVYRQLFLLVAEARNIPRSSGWIAPWETAAPSDCVLADGDLLEVVCELSTARPGKESFPIDFSTLPTEHMGSAYAWLLELRPVVDLPSRAFGLEPVAGHARRTTGSYYTPELLIEAVLGRALDPLLDEACASPEPESALLSLTVCDPACGSGHFLIAAAKRIASRLQQLRGPACPQRAALREVMARCIHGVDLNPMAIELCKAALWLEAGDPDLAMNFLDRKLLCGNALLGATPSLMQGPSDRQSADRWCADLLASKVDMSGATPDQVAALCEQHRVLHWHLAFPAVFGGREPDPAAGRRGGFDCIVGNPPWIAHAGRAAQPLDPGVRAFHDLCNPAFAGYKSTHGMFVYLAATLLRPGGRLGLVIPTSVADLDGYLPVRRAHDRLCEVLPSLADFGDMFEGVFQPCMALVSVRRQRPCDEPCPGHSWELERKDLSEGERALLATLSALPCLPASLFGERGLQTTAEMRRAIVKADRAMEPCTVALREGTDVREFETRKPRMYADPGRLSRALRAAPQWQEVAVLIRQTARWPIATASDGAAFRNSILAGFEREGWDRAVMLCLLNSTLVRWYHYTRFRDARQGMPQVKIGHLRAIPAPTSMSEAAVESLRELGARLMERNAGIEEEDRARMDALVFGCYGLSAGQRRIVTGWWATAPGRGAGVTPSADGS